MHLVQVLALPGIPIQEMLRLGPEPIVTLKCVEVQPPGKSPILATLLETEGTTEHMTQSPDVDIRRIGKVLRRLSFSLLHPFNVFSARLIPKGLRSGMEMKALIFPGAPPGIAIFEGKIGFNQQTAIYPDFLAGELPPKVDGAITWFLNGNFADNSVQQVICHWIGLEMIAPVVTIREFLEKNLGVDRKEYKKLYDLRCRISHGGLSMDPEGLEVASKKAARIQQLLLQAIKQALNWPTEAPPTIQPDGYTMVGVPGLLIEGIVPEGDFYHQPGIYPG